MRRRSFRRFMKFLPLVLLFAGLQLLFFRLSLLPAIAHR